MKHLPSGSKSLRPSQKIQNEFAHYDSAPVADPLFTSNSNKVKDHWQRCTVASNNPLPETQHVGPGSRYGCSHGSSHFIISDRQMDAEFGNFSERLLCTWQWATTAMQVGQL